MGWLPHDLVTWSFVLTVATLILAVPLGIVGNLLAPKILDWWSLRSVRRAADELPALVAYSREIEKAPLFSPTEALIFRQQINVIKAVHILAYLVILAVTLIPNWHPHIPFSEAQRRIPLGERFSEVALNSIPVVPLILFLAASYTFFMVPALDRLQRSAPEERARVITRINHLIEVLKKKMP